MPPDNSLDPTKHLKVLDIALWDSHLHRFVEYPSMEDRERLGYQSMRGVRVDLAGMINDDGDEIDVLKVFVSLGIRCISVRKPSNDGSKSTESSGDAEEETVLYSLESTFSVDYEILDPMPEEFVSSFANFNAVHNVWPFWRQHVYDTLKRASLPFPDVPFFPGQPSKSAEP